MYEITQWNGKQELAELDNTTILIDPILLNDAILKLMNEDTTIEDDIIDIDFNFGVKKADRYDYCFAIFSGILSSLISKYVKMSGDLDLEKMDFAQLIHLVKDINIKVQKNNEKATADIEKTLNNIEEVLRDANSYKNLAVDFASDFSMMGLLISIIEKVFGKEIGYDENNTLVVNEAKETFDNLSFIEKQVEFAIFEWFLEQVDQYKQNGKFKKQLENILEWGSIVKNLEPIIKDFSQINLSKEELKQWFVNFIQDKNQRISKLDFLQKENIPTQFNQIMIHTYVHIKNLIEQVKEHKITTLEGLEIIDFNRIDNERVILRLETVSTGVFFAMDAGAAVALAAAYACGSGDITGAVKILANTINFSNILSFTYVVKQDATYIKEDIDEILHKAKVEVVHHYKDLSEDELDSYITLNDPETRILYSLKLHMIEEDIQCTKLSADQQLKNEWKKQWMEVSKNSLHMAKLYEPNIQKVYQALITHAENTINNKTWLYNIILELCLFSPYYQIDEDEKKYKKLKLVNKNLDYMKNYFCEGQKYVSFKDIKQFESLYKHYHGYIENKNLKMAGTAGAVVAVGAGVGVGAMIFAPQIAVALFGGAFPGLHGAALVNAALAAAGGGSLAAGGFGMAGGSVIIAGGGALLGMSTASVATMGLLASPNFVQADDAKLLAKCNYVLLNQMHEVDVVVAIQKMTEESLNGSKTQLKVLESSKNKSDECKKTISALKKSVKYMEKTNDELKKLITKEEKKQ